MLIYWVITMYKNCIACFMTSDNLIFLPLTWGKFDPRHLIGEETESDTTQSNLQIQCNQTSNGIFTELEQKTSQFVGKHKRPWIAKVILRKKNGAGGITLMISHYTKKLQ